MATPKMVTVTHVASIARPLTIGEACGEGPGDYETFHGEGRRVTSEPNAAGHGWRNRPEDWYMSQAEAVAEASAAFRAAHPDMEVPAIFEFYLGATNRSAGCVAHTNICVWTTEEPDPWATMFDDIASEI